MTSTNRNLSRHAQSVRLGVLALLFVCSATCWSATRSTALTRVRVENGSVLLKNDHGSVVLKAGQRGQLQSGRAPSIAAEGIEDLLPAEAVAILIYEDFSASLRADAEMPLARVAMKPEIRKFVDDLRKRMKPGTSRNLAFDPIELISAERAPARAREACQILSGKLLLAWRLNQQGVMVAELKKNIGDETKQVLEAWFEETAGMLGVSPVASKEPVGDFELEVRDVGDRRFAWCFLDGAVVAGQDLGLVQMIASSATFGAAESYANDAFFSKYRKNIRARKTDADVFFLARTVGNANATRQAPQWFRNLGDGGLVFVAAHAAPFDGVTRTEIVFGHAGLSGHVATHGIKKRAPSAEPRESRVLRYTAPNPYVIARTLRADVLAGMLRTIIKDEIRGGPDEARVSGLLPLLDQVGREGAMTISWSPMAFQVEPDTIVALELKNYTEFEDLLRAALGDQFEKLFARAHRGARLIPRLSPTDRTCVALDPEGGAVLMANVLPALRRAIDRARSGFSPRKRANKAGREALARLDAWAARHDLAVVGDVPSAIQRLHPLVGMLQLFGALKNIGPLPPPESLSEFSMVAGGVSVAEEGLRMLVEHPFSLSPVWEVQAALLGQEKKRARHVAQPSTVVRSAVPIDVRWRPGRRIVNADGQRIVLAGRPGKTWQGQDPSGRFHARSDPNGTLEVLDKHGQRKSVRRPDGAWSHHFDGKLMQVDAEGRIELRAGGDVLKGSGIKAPAPARPVAAHRWQLGVGLDHAVKDEMRVQQVYKGSPAAKAGLLPGDRIIAIGKRERPSQREVVNELKAAVPGARIRIVVRRAGVVRTLHAISGDWDAK